MASEAIQLPTLRCLRCGHVWVPRQSQPPVKCASRPCGSPYWNRPKVKMSGQKPKRRRKR